jgi:F0F1-type ATP synthase assembly protein I
MTGEAGGPERGTRRGAAAPSVGEYAGVGLQFALTIVGFMFAGMWLDRALGTSPWLVVLLVFVGASAGFYAIYRKLMAAQRRADEARRTTRETR